MPSTTAITGAGTGIGRAIALRLATEGHSLALMARNEDRLHATAEDALKQGAAAVSVHSCDIREKTQVDEAFGAAHAAEEGTDAAGTAATHSEVPGWCEGAPER